MDSWSRPSKSQATPPPFYLTEGENARYCHSCGRVIGNRRVKSAKAGATEVKYCSDKCKRHKPSAAPESLDMKISSALLRLLSGQDPGDSSAEQILSKAAPAKTKQKAKKGDPRIIVKMSDLETAVFGNVQDPTKIYGRNKNRAKRGLPDPQNWTSIDMEDPPHQPRFEQAEEQDTLVTSHDENTAGDMVPLSNHVRPSQLDSDVNGSIGGEKGWAERIDESPEMLKKRLEGQKRADDRELVRNVARKAVVFGLVADDNEGAPGQSKRADESDKGRRLCEAVMNGSVVEPSFAKGDWSIRWRED